MAYKRNTTPLESDEGKEFIAWLRLNGLRAHHSPNETGHSEADKRRAIRMKRQGTSAGYPDYTILLPNRGILFIELKRLSGSSTSAEQKEWIAAINEIPGAEAYVAKGAEEAKEIVKRFLEIKEDGAIF